VADVVPDTIRTPAVVLDETAVEHNIATVIRLVAGAERWRPHVKTARTRWTVDRLRAAGVGRFKVSTFAELSALLAFGVPDVLVAQPLTYATRPIVAMMAARFPGTVVSVLVEDAKAASGWARPVDVFIDLDPGLGRTGVPLDDLTAVIGIADAWVAAGHRLAGLHVYDGHLADHDPAAKREAVSRELAQISSAVEALRAAGHEVGEVVVAGTHTFMEHARQRASVSWGDLLTFGAGTVVYNDQRSLERFAAQKEGADLVAAAAVVARVISKRSGGLTVDAGLTAIQVDAGVPHAVVISDPELHVGRPSQEHLFLEGADHLLEPGNLVVLLPRHLDTALVQFDCLHRIAADRRITVEHVIAPRTDDTAS